MAIKGIAEQLLGVGEAKKARQMKEETLVQSLPSPVQAFAKAFEKQTSDIFKAERADIIGHEYEIDPYRRARAERLAGTTVGKEAWGEIAKEFNTARETLRTAREALEDEKNYAKYKVEGAEPGKPTGDFTEEAIKGLGEGKYLKTPGKKDEEIQVKGVKGGYRLFIVDTTKKPGTKGRVKQSSEVISIDKIVQDPNVAGAIKASSKLVGVKKGKKVIDKEATKKAKEELEAKIKQAESDLTKARTRFNKEIPGRSELDQLWKDYLIILGAQSKGRAPGAEKVSDEYKLKFKSNEDLAKRIEGKDLKLTAVTDAQALNQIGGFSSSTIVDMNQGFSVKAVEDGKVGAAWNSIASGLRKINEKTFKTWVSNYEDGVDADIKAIDKQENDTMKLLYGYKLLTRVVPVVANNGANAATGLSRDMSKAITRRAFAGINPTTDFKTGEWNMIRYEEDVQDITDTIIDENKGSWNVEDTTRDMYDRVIDRLDKDIPRINIKTLVNRIEPENCAARLKDELLSELDVYAPANEQQYEQALNDLRAKKQTPRALWLELYTEANGGRLPNYTAINNIREGIRKRGEIQKAGIIASGILGY